MLISFCPIKEPNIPMSFPSSVHGLAKFVSMPIHALVANSHENSLHFIAFILTLSQNTTRVVSLQLFIARCHILYRVLSKDCIARSKKRIRIINYLIRHIGLDYIIRRRTKHHYLLFDFHHCVRARTRACVSRKIHGFRKKQNLAS